MANNLLTRESPGLKPHYFSDKRFLSKNKKVIIHGLTHLWFGPTDGAQESNWTCTHDDFRTSYASSIYILCPGGIFHEIEKKKISFQLFSNKKINQIRKFHALKFPNFFQTKPFSCITISVISVLNQEMQWI